MENLSPPEKKKEGLHLTDYMKKELQGATNWAMFLSISMITFFVLYFISILSSINSGLPLAGTTGGLIGIILFISLLGLLLGIGIVLYLFSSNLKKALKQKRSALLNHSFDLLTRYFILSFIILIVILLFSLVFTIFIF
jgi:hypothetical protein